MRDCRRKIKSLSKLKRIIRGLKEKRKKIVFTNGCFDILHSGHIKYLEAAKGKGDILVVAINSDKSIKGIKGEGRPIIGDKERAEIVSALECVNYVTIFNENTPIETIKALSPDVLIKGGDWRKKDIVGSGYVESYGGKVITGPYIKGYSTTRIIDRIKKIDG